MNSSGTDLVEEQSRHLRERSSRLQSSVHYLCSAAPTVASWPPSGACAISSSTAAGGDGRRVPRQCATSSKAKLPSARQGKCGARRQSRLQRRALQQNMHKQNGACKCVALLVVNTSTKRGMCIVCTSLTAIHCGCWAQGVGLARLKGTSLARLRASGLAP